MHPRTEALHSIFSPGTVAIVGASEDPDKLGGRPLAMSLKAGFGGRLYPVNARVDNVQGQQAYRSLADLPEPVELVVLAVPQAAVEAELTAAAGAGAKAAIVFASDYAETGPVGRARQEALQALARRQGLRLLGPNCMGAFNVHANFYPTFLQAFDHYDGQGWPEPGDIAIVSQSGAIGSHLFVMMRDKGLGLSKFLTTGNQSDIDVADGIAFLADDPATKVVAVYLEGATDGSRLLDALVAARSKGKKVVVLKVGESTTGSAAILSHTASVAGSDRIYEALLHAGAAYRAHSLTELVEVATAASTGGGYAIDESACVFSLSGGGGVILADACEKAGLTLPAMSDDARHRMRDIVPFSATQNPIDPGGPAMTNAGIVLDFLRIACEDSGRSTLFLFLTHLGHVPRMMAPLQQGFEALKRAHPEILFVVIALGSNDLGKQLRRSGFLVFDEPISAVRAVKALRYLQRLPDPPAILPQTQPPSQPPDDWSEVGARRLVEEAGIPVVAHTVANTAQEAGDAVERYGVPCAIKLNSKLLPHRAAVGGVKLNVEGREAAEAAYSQLLTVWKATGIAGTPSGILVSPMIVGTNEIFIGTRTEPGLATVVTLGRGGGDVECAAGLVMRLAPVDPAQANAMIEEAGRNGVFGAVTLSDAGTVAAVVVALAKLATERSAHIGSIEINPFIVGAAQAFAVDALMTPVANPDRS